MGVLGCLGCGAHSGLITLLAVLPSSNTLLVVFALFQPRRHSQLPGCNRAQVPEHLGGGVADLLEALSYRRRSATLVWTAHPPLHQRQRWQQRGYKDPEDQQ